MSEVTTSAFERSKTPDNVIPGLRGHLQTDVGGPFFPVDEQEKDQVPGLSFKPPTLLDDATQMMQQLLDWNYGLDELLEKIEDIESRYGCNMPTTLYDRILKAKEAIVATIPLCREWMDEIEAGVIEETSGKRSTMSFAEMHKALPDVTKKADTEKKDSLMSVGDDEVRRSEVGVTVGSIAGGDDQGKGGTRQGVNQSEEADEELSYGGEMDPETHKATLSRTGTFRKSAASPGVQSRRAATPADAIPGMVQGSGGSKTGKGAHEA